MSALVLALAVATSSAADRQLTDFEALIVGQVQDCWDDLDDSRVLQTRCEAKLTRCVEVATQPLPPETRLPAWVLPALGTVSGFAVGAPFIQDEPSVPLVTTGVGLLVGLLTEVLR